MAVNPRNLLLFAALSGAAMLTWVLARDPQVSQGRAQAPASASRAYYLEGAVLYGTDDDGRVGYWINADRVEQQVEDDSFSFEGLSVEYSPETNVRWSFSAARGMAPADRAYLQMTDDVRVIHSPAASDVETVVTTNELRLYPDERRATANGDVVVDSGALGLTATGIRIDLNTDVLGLYSVRFRHGR